jgi:hypothetical protein
MTSYNAGERKDVRQAEKAQALAEAGRKEIITLLMSTTPGRAWVLYLLEAAHIFTTSFDRDAIAMAFSEGERNQGLILLNDVLLNCPDSYILMLRERNERHLASERTRRPNSNGGDQGPDATSGDEDTITSDASDTTH